jgi:protein-disulfide isomerase-like protein with CxxC motif
LAIASWAVTAIDFYFDPACPWTWITAEWVREVAPYRDLDVTWKTYSLLVKNGAGMPDHYRIPIEAQWPGLRVIQQARNQYGNEAVSALYRSFGTAIHYDGDNTLKTLAECVKAAGVDVSVLSAADDASLDDSIHTSTAAGVALTGADVGVPIIAVENLPMVYFGPVMSPAPTGEDALRLWDAYVTLASIDGVYEIKRTRTVGPTFGPRPKI